MTTLNTTTNTTRNALACLLLAALFALAPSAAMADPEQNCLDYIEQNQHQLAFPHCQNAADQGKPSAIYNLGWMYDHGIGAPQDKIEGNLLYQRAAALGHSKAQFNLAWQYDHGDGVRQNRQKAMRFYRLAADQGNEFAQNNLGNMYENGHGVQKDMRLAIKWYSLSADQNDVIAINNLARLHENGLGFQKDPEQAAKLYQRAANLGYPLAQYNIARFYLSGNGIQKKPNRALQLFKSAAQQGNTPAQSELGRLYREGDDGIVPDLKQARYFSDIAAQNGDVPSQYRIGMMHLNGEGAPADPERAYIWLSIASVSGHQQAIKDRQKARQQLLARDAPIPNNAANDMLAEIERRNAQNRVIPAAYQPPDIASTPAFVPTNFPNHWRHVVAVQADDQQATGVIVRPDVIATNCQSIDGAAQINIFAATDNQTFNRDIPLPAAIARFNSDSDFCLLRVPALSGAPAPAGAARALKAGAPVFTLAPRANDKLTFDNGKIKLLFADDLDAPVIDTDMPYSPSAAGAPLFDGDGLLVGIVSRKWATDDNKQLVTALPIEWITQQLQ